MNVFAAGHRHQPWLWQVTTLCFFLGVLIAASLQTVSNINRSGLQLGRIGQPVAIAQGRTETLKKLEKEIAELRAHNTELETSLGEGKGQVKLLSDELLKTKIMAGLTPVKGPGVIVTLQDSKRRPSPMRTLEANSGIIHDVDIQSILNELSASGAEALAVNEQRIIARGSLRCVGPTVLVNNIAISPPYVIHAIGDPATLYGGLNLPYGPVDQIRRFDPEMVRIEKRDQIELPAYTGSTEVRYAKPVLESIGASGRKVR